MVELKTRVNTQGYFAYTTNDGSCFIMGLQVFSGSFFSTYVAELTLSSFGLVVFVGLW